MLKKIILVLFISIFIIPSCSSKTVNPPEPTITKKEAVAMVEKAFIESCIITMARMHSMPYVNEIMIGRCEELWTLYVSGVVGITPIQNQQPPPET